MTILRIPTDAKLISFNVTNLYRSVTREEVLALLKDFLKTTWLDPTDIEDIDKLATL